MGSCGKRPNLELTSLTLYRDPLLEARKIDEWRAIIRSDSADVCQTTLTIIDAESKKPISQETKIDLTLGANEVPLYSIDDYRPSRQPSLLRGRCLPQRRKSTPGIAAPVLRTHHRPPLVVDALITTFLLLDRNSRSER